MSLRPSKLTRGRNTASRSGTGRRETKSQRVISASTTRPTPRRSIRKISAMSMNCRNSLHQEVPNDRVEETQYRSGYVDRRLSWTPGGGPALTARLIQFRILSRGQVGPSTHTCQCCRRSSAHGPSLCCWYVLLLECIFAATAAAAQGF